MEFGAVRVENPGTNSCLLVVGLGVLDLASRVVGGGYIVFGGMEKKMNEHNKIVLGLGLGLGNVTRNPKPCLGFRV